MAANFTLVSASEDGERGEFHVMTRNSDAPADVAIQSAPIDHTLHLSAVTTNAPVRVELPETFEGFFRVSSALSRTGPEVQYHLNVTDPKGMGRRRTVEYNKRGTESGDGNVFWGSRRSGYKLGNVIVETTDSSLTLKL